MWILFLPAIIFINGCQNTSETQNKSKSTTTLFRLLPSEQTHVLFSNALTEGPNTNVLMYEYFYNGGGVAVGDVNGDGFDDLYFSGNMTANKLYLNEHKMEFKDVTGAAGVAGRPGPWANGVTMADVNGDGKLDIYVCYSGKLPPEKRANQLFINGGNDAQGIPHFSEQAAKYGLASEAFSTQAYFFDFDLDGDLDMFLLNHNPDALPELDEKGTAETLKNEEPFVGVRLFQNNRGHFVDITKTTGLSSSALTYGLGAGIADINGDGWPDIYISNDYSVPDYLYINNRDGTFTDKIQSAMGHTSLSSMGNDVVDINNDGLPDIFTLDMLAPDNHRQKLLFTQESYEKFDQVLRTGHQYQYTRNMLQVNNGDGTFSEIGQLAGLSNSDWSWAPLFADFDNDGWKDCFISNGNFRDVTNLDYITYQNQFVKHKGRLTRQDVMELAQTMPSSHLVNDMFKNQGGVNFTNENSSWGFDIPANGNGAAYADLDNDGDLDLVVNCINRPALVYENQTDKQLENHYLNIRLQGAGLNTHGLGAKVTIYLGGKQQYQEQMPVRGFESGVSPVLHFGLGKATTADSMRILWPGKKEQKLSNIQGDRLLVLFEKNAVKAYGQPKKPKPIFEETRSPIDFSDKENNVNDFKRQPLMLSPMSFFGPCLVKADVNGDGLEDVFAGGGTGQPGSLYLQQASGKFIKNPEPAFNGDAKSDDVDALFFDANGDGYMDLYVCSGGYGQYAADDNALQDRLYLNDGKGNFTKQTHALPVMKTSTSCVRAADVNGDGFPDLFVGGRVIPGRYPEVPTSYLLVNDGKGQFTDRTTDLAPALQKIGMVTDAAWLDLNGDDKKDMIVTGEWMPVSAFVNVDGKLENKTKDYFDQEYSGWWNKILVEDLNGDGKPDLVVGNYGQNAQFKVSDKEPAEMYAKDFDHNGTVDPILCYYIQHKSYPALSRDELIRQIGYMQAKFPDYKGYADATITDIFSKEELKGAQHLVANIQNTSYFQRVEDGRFHLMPLPIEVQYAPVFSMLALDYNGDGKKDLLLCGNINQARLKFGKVDANHGLLLQGDGNGHFSSIPQWKSGLQLLGDVRDVLQINGLLLFGLNQQNVKAYKKPVLTRK